MPKHKPEAKTKSKKQAARRETTPPSISVSEQADVNIPTANSTPALGTPRRKRNAPEMMTPLSMRLRRSVHVLFIEFADERKLSYPEALEALLDNAIRAKRAS
jgi:hypothetical protein